MSSDVKAIKLAAGIFMVTDEVLNDAINSASDYLDYELAQVWLDMDHGPRLGPGRRELNAILAPSRRRARILANVREQMPNRRPGRFTR